ncbi:hypothetical protein, partial [Streptomyces acidiscabies]|uniref:hypothetical protein n=1 Tax=Streptomyces acidiscabies TaxID=42234 RepID=UPI001C4CD447
RLFKRRRSPPVPAGSTLPRAALIAGRPAETAREAGQHALLPRLIPATAISHRHGGSPRSCAATRPVNP